MADNATIVIGAQDQASKILQQIGQNTEKLTSTVNKMATAAKAATVVLLPLAAITAGIRAMQGLSSTLDAATEAYNKQARAARGMSDETLAVTAQWQKSLGVGDEVSLQLIRQAQMLGMTEEQAREATKAAMGLSTATGRSLEHSLRQVHKAMQDGTDITEIANRGLAEMQSQMDSLEGVQSRATNSMGDLMEVIGNIIAPIKMLTAQGFAIAAEVLQDVLAPAANMANAAMRSMGPVMEWVAEKVVGAITLAEVVFLNFPKIIEAAMASAELSVRGFVEDIIHFHTVQIPAVLKWFVENWKTLIQDSVNAGIAIFVNFHKNVAEIMIRLWDFIKSGMSGGLGQLASDIGEIAGRNLLAGFEAQTTTLPQIIDRQLTGREKELKDRLAAIGDDLGGQFQDKFNRRMDMVKNGFQETLGELAKLETGAGLLAGKSGGSGLQAVESRLLTRGTSDDPAKVIQRNTEQMAKLQAEANQKHERTARALERQREQRLDVRVIS